MKRPHRQRLLLFLAVVAIVATAAWQWRWDTLHENDMLTSLEPAHVSRITLSMPHAPTLHYEKRQGHWWRTDGPPMRADDARLNDLADTAAAHVLQWRPAADFDAAKIGLSPPQATLNLDGVTLEFGETSVTGPQHYVRVGKRVALVPARYVPRSPAAATVELH